MEGSAMAALQGIGNAYCREWSLTMSSAAPCLNGSTSLRYRGLPAKLSKCANEEALDLREEVLSTSMFEEIVGSSEAIIRVAAQVMRVAPAAATVLITGESGTGKE